MSHIATVTLNLSQLEKRELENICDKNTELLNNMLLSNEYQNNSLIKEAIKQIENVKSNINQKVEMDLNSYKGLSLYELEYDKVNKLLLNIIDTVDYRKIDNSISIENFNHYVYEFGKLAYEARDLIINSNLELTEDNLNLKINELMNAKASIEELRSFKNSIYTKISKIKNNELKQYFEDKIKIITTKKDIDDFKIWFKEKNNSILKADKIAKPFIEFLMIKEKYKLVGKQIKVVNEKLGVIYLLENDLEEQVIFNVSPDGTVEYQIGDYKRHVCSKTADQMLEYITKNSNMNIVKYTVNRTFVATKPKYSAKEKIKRWGN